MMSYRLRDVSTKSTEPEGAVYTLRIERNQLDRLHEIAKAEHRTLSQELRRMVEERIAAHDAQVPA